MSIVPNGRPAWSRTADYQSYGGHLNKVNYQSQGVTNPLTDDSAEQHARACDDLSSVSRTAAFAKLTVQCQDTGALPPLILVTDMMTGRQTASYQGDNAPAGFPSAVRNGNGDVTFTFDSSYSDDYGVSEAFTPQHPIASPHGATAQTETVVVSGQTVRVRIFDLPAGTLAVNPKFTLEVA